MLRRVIANSEADCKASPSLGELLRAEITRTGPLTCARFMELALYHPELGYYERDRAVVGPRGDFYTSVSVGELFGQLLAAQFAGWLKELGMRNAELGIADAPLPIVEAGAHDGLLAEDILRWLHAHHPALHARTEYWLLEPSPRRQAWQRARLAPFAPQVRWFANWDELHAAGGIHGLLFANELLDAFPVHRLLWSAAEQRWVETGIGTAADRLIWTPLAELSAPVAGLAEPAAALHNVPAPYRASVWDRLAPHLPDGFVLERSPAAERWWADAARTLRHGKLLTCDYGHPLDEPLSPTKPAGTLRAYRRHQLSDDLLAAPGTQDLTAHVNFAALAHAGEQAGLVTEDFTPQARFLTRLAQRAFAPAAAFGEWTRDRTRQFQTLTHPEHLGRSFSVLVQARRPPLASTHPGASEPAAAPAP